MASGLFVTHRVSSAFGHRVPTMSRRKPFTATPDRTGRYRVVARVPFNCRKNLEAVALREGIGIEQTAERLLDLGVRVYAYLATTDDPPKTLEEAVRRFADVKTDAETP